MDEIDIKKNAMEELDLLMDENFNQLKTEYQNNKNRIFIIRVLQNQMAYKPQSKHVRFAYPNGFNENRILKSLEDLIHNNLITFRHISENSFEIYWSDKFGEIIWSDKFVSPTGS